MFTFAESQEMDKAGLVVISIPFVLAKQRILIKVLVLVSILKKGEVFRRFPDSQNRFQGMPIERRLIVRQKMVVGVSKPEEIFE